MSKKSVKFPAWISSLILSGLSFIEVKINTWIKDAFLSRGVATLFSPIRAIVTVLSDDNENNAAQVKSVFLSYVNHDLTAYLTSISAEVIDQLENEKMALVLNRMVPTALMMLSDVTDDIPDNAAQIKKRWSDLLLDDTFQDLIMEEILATYLRRKIKDEEAADLAISQIGQWVDWADDKFEVDPALTMLSKA